MRIYISGPVTDVPNYYDNFANARHELEELGFSVLNPVSVQCGMPADTTYKEFMKLSMCMLEMCDAIYMLEGWQDSDGAKAEYHYANSLGLHRIYKGFDGKFYKEF